MQENRRFHCAVNPISGHELRLGSIPPPVRSLKIAVIGGGPGGLEAAADAAERGHDVVLLEKTSSLGGLLRYTDYDDLKIDLKRFKNHLIHRVQTLPIDVRLNTEATEELLRALAPDAIIAATGSQPVHPRIPGLDKYGLHVLDSYGKELGKSVLVLGGGLAGCERAVSLAQEGYEVSLVEMLPELSKDANWMQREGMMAAFQKYHIHVYTSTTCLRVYRDGIQVRTPDGTETRLPSDSVVYALGLRSQTPDREKGREIAYDYYEIGDCVKPRKVNEAVHEGFYAATGIGRI